MWNQDIIIIILSLSLSLSHMMILCHASALKWPNSIKNRHQIGIDYPDQILQLEDRKNPKHLLWYGVALLANFEKN